MRRNADREIKEEEEEKVRENGKMGVYIDLLGGLLHCLQTLLAVFSDSSLLHRLLHCHHLCLHALYYRAYLSSQCLLTVSLHGVSSRVSLHNLCLHTFSRWVFLPSLS